MDKDESLEEFVQILGRIRELTAQETTADDNGLNLDDVVKQLRLDGENDDADELAELIERADALKAQQKAK